MHGAVTWTFDPATGLELRKPHADNTAELKACDAENRPTDFTSQAADGTITSVHCEYDYMGRRTTKMVTVGNNVTLQQRYIYRGYLQIASIDHTRSHHPALWFITWDPTQPVATRPLAIQKDGSWFTYGWDPSAPPIPTHPTGRYPPQGMWSRPSNGAASSMIPNSASSTTITATIIRWMAGGLEEIGFLIIICMEYMILLCQMIYLD